MAENALQARPPLAKWRDFVTEADGMINLKLYGVRPFVDCARIVALAHGLPPTGTAVRFRAAVGAGAVPQRDAEATVAAFFFIQQVRLRHQAALDNLTEENANRIDPNRLNELDRRTLKEAFRLERDMQSRLALDYQLR